MSSDNCNSFYRNYDYIEKDIICKKTCEIKYTQKPFKRNSHFDADNTKDSDNSFTRNQKEIKKNQYEK